MAELTVQKIERTGLNPTYSSAASGGDTAENPDLEGRVFLHAKNGSAGALDVQVDSQEDCDQGFDHDVTVSIPAGEERLIGPFPRDRFGNPLSISYPSGVTSLTIAAIRLTK